MLQKEGRGNGVGSELSLNWRVLLGAFLGIATGMSSLYFYSAGLFLKPVAAEFGLARGQVSMGPLVGTLCVAVIALPTGRLIDRIGAERAGVAGLLILSVSFFALAFLTGGLWSFLLLTALMACAATTSSTLVFSRIIVGAFQRQRGLALGIALTGTGVGGVLVPLFTTPFIASHGWRPAYMILGLLPLVSAPFVWILLRSSTASLPPARHSADWRRMLAGRTFGTLAIVFFLAALGVLGVLFHYVPLLSDAGVEPAAAGRLASVIGISIIGARAITGAMLDRLSAIPLTCALLSFAGIGMMMLALGGSNAAIVGAMVIGLAVGAEVDLIAYLVSRYTPLPAYGATYGALYAIYLLGGALAPFAIGYAFDLTGSYQLPLFASAACLFVAGAVVWTLPPMPPVRPTSTSA